MDSRKLDRARTASVVVTIVAVGVVAASFIATPEGGGTEAAAPNFVTEPVEYPVAIPGCDDVQEPPPEGESQLISRATFGGDGYENTYDNSAYPWLTAGKAAVMSEAVRAALPADVDVVMAAPSQSLSFGPVVAIDIPGYEPVSTATAELTRDGSTAFVSIGVGPSDEAVPPCVAGNLERRDRGGDGTVVDINDTWYEFDGARTNSRSAIAYRQDGTRINVNLSAPSSSTLPLEHDEIARIAALPELAVSAATPSDAPVLREDCTVYASDDGTARDIRPDALEAANAALTTSWSTLPNPPALDRPVGSLVPAGFGSAICTDNTVVGSSTRLSISVVGGQPLPTAPDPYDPSFYGQLPENRTLPDGSVAQYFDVDVANMMTSEDGTGLLSRSVTVTRPSGVQVSARSTVDFGANGRAPLTLPEPLPFEVLDVLAATPIEEWP